VEPCTSYVALGDSFTEGLDDRRPDGTFRGWADLVAAELAAATPGLRYANLAVRGRRLAAVRDAQLPRALAMQPALVSVSAGGNDLLGFSCDVPEVARGMHELLESLVRTGATVVVFTGFNPRGRLPLGRQLAVRVLEYNARVLASAAELGVRVVDLWDLPGLYQDRRWAPDRLHLSASGHALVAAAVLRELGADLAVAAADPEEGDVRRPWISARRSDVDWARRYLAPWLSRQLRGRSAGDLVDPKLPELTELRTGSRPPGHPPSRSAQDVRAAVHVDDLAGRGGEPVRQQGHHGPGQSGAVAGVPAERGAPGPLLDELVVPRQGLGQQGAVRAGRDQVDADPLRPEVARELPAGRLERGPGHPQPVLPRQHPPRVDLQADDGRAGHEQALQGVRQRGQRPGSGLEGLGHR